MAVILPILAVFSVFNAVFAATERTDAARAGASRAVGTIANSRQPTTVAGLNLPAGPSIPSGQVAVTGIRAASPVGAISAQAAAEQNSQTCREAYRDCMDQFCLLDQSEGERCSCSDNIAQSKPLLREINDIRAEAEKLYGEGVEREKYGAKADIVFGQSQKAKSKGIDYLAWINSGAGSQGLDADEYMGDMLYQMAADACATRLEACGPDAAMEETLYQRMIANDCRAFNTYLADQKKFWQDEKAIAEKAVRAARVENLPTTNRFNRGECLLAYRSCISDKGGCGANFENCLDAELLNRRANACDNILDECMAVRKYVQEDWKAESVMILADAAKFADQNRRLTCRARTWACLEDACSYATNSQCLNNVNVAAGLCPVIDECNAMVPGFRNGIRDDLGFLRVRFCQNDINKCLQERCGANFTRPECVGKRPSDIFAMCPQDMFPSCKNEDQFEVIMSAAMLQMDYQLMVGCINYFSEQLGNACGIDMECLGASPEIENARNIDALRELNRANSDGRTIMQEFAQRQVDEFFKQFEKDMTVKQCAGAVGKNVFNTAKLVARMHAEDRLERQFLTRLAEESRKQSVEQARKNCEDTFASLKTSSSTEDMKGEKSGTWVLDAVFEPELRNCKILRRQKVCAVSGKTAGSNMLKGMAGGLAAGAAAGSMVPGWGTAIGGAVGAFGGLFAGRAAGGERTECQDIDVWENINM